jgi:hypothetical protein
MANKTKNIMGGAMSGAAAGTAVMPGWGTAIGAVAGGLMGAFTGSEDKEKQKMLDQSLIDRLANQALGNEATASELNMRQAFDKTLAQQIAAARTQSRGVNPALQSRNIARMASEQAANAAAESAKLAVQERAASFDKYAKAIAYNNGVLEANNAQDAAQEKQGNLALANGLNAGAAVANQYAVKNDALNQMKQSQPSSKNTSDVNTSGVFGSGQAAQAQNAAYGMGADQTAAPSALGANVGLTNQSQQFGQYTPPNNNMFGTSDKNAKTNIKPVSGKMNMVVTSDERQKDLIKSEDLPANNNLGMQNMQAAQPAAPAQGAAMQSTVQPAAQPGTQQNQPASIQGAAPVAAQSANNQNLLITPEMISRANTSMRAGGSVSDIQNDMTQLSMPQALTPQQDAQYRADAKREAARQDTWDNRLQGKNQDENQLYQSYLNRFNTSNAEQMAAYNQNKEQIDAINKAKSLERSARLANFYTGMSTTTPQDVAQGYANKKIFGNQQQLNDSSAGASTQDWIKLADWGANPGGIINNALGLKSIGQTVGGDVGNFLQNPLGSASSAISSIFSDERVKTDVKSTKSSEPNMNPKSFLDKLHAYSYEYKDAVKNDPRASTKPQLGILAQDLEKAGPVGEQMVQEDPATGIKQVDFGKGFGAILASQVTLNQRLKELESKYGKKKEEA